ncbi:hypothetical protein AGMMS49543_12770 [Betaproteobacteria bacterium]|nr:hypothetical protein AGMMS49543_12770 [Betaproteobacteria bacterium]GHU09997.1 hypothetical protein AGMMS50225_12340 [Betaproteobacteria bacterium]GHU22957.1 hypothetical protein AGMMS50243_23510 [Betaproteobacteria bacterium]
MLTWMVFVVTPVIFIFVGLFMFRSGQAAMRFLMFVAVVGLVWGGIDHFRKPDPEAEQEAKLLVDKWAAAMHVIMDTGAAGSGVSMERLDFDASKINRLIESLPENHRFPKLHRIVLDGLQLSLDGIELARSALRIKRDVQDGRLAQDAAARRLKKIISDAAEMQKEGKENLKKMCAYMAQPEKPLKKSAGKDLPQWCQEYVAGRA